MKQQKVCVVELQPHHPEYRTVASKFQETCAQFKIEKVSLPRTWGFSMVEKGLSWSWINTFSLSFVLSQIRIFYGN